MLFTTSIIWQNLEVYEDEIQEWIEYATGKRIMIGVRSTDSKPKSCYKRPRGKTKCSVVIITFNHSSSPVLCSLNIFLLAMANDDLKLAPRNTAGVLAWVTARKVFVANRLDRFNSHQLAC